MMDKYAAYIQARYGTVAKAFGQAPRAVQAMCEAFPELTPVGGDYITPLRSVPITHWWCVDAQGGIIDPTAAQYAPGGIYKRLRDDRSIFLEEAPL